MDTAGSHAFRSHKFRQVPIVVWSESGPEKRGGVVLSRPYASRASAAAEGPSQPTLHSELRLVGGRITTWPTSPLNYSLGDRFEPS